jgi:hypothetical protein
MAALAARTLASPRCAHAADVPKTTVARTMIVMKEKLNVGRLWSRITHPVREVQFENNRYVKIRGVLVLKDARKKFTLG